MFEHYSNEISAMILFPILAIILGDYFAIFALSLSVFVNFDFARTNKTLINYELFKHCIRIILIVLNMYTTFVVYLDLIKLFSTNV